MSSTFPADSAVALLEINHLCSGYGHNRVLNDVSLVVASGEIVALLGPNGCGKSTLLKTVFGLLPCERGFVRFKGVGNENASPVQNLHAGIAYMPQGGRVFSDLTVRENLEIAAFTLSLRDAREQLSAAFKQFPILGDRSQQVAKRLSGGERQVLTLAMALITKPTLLLLDEPLLNLAPRSRADILGMLRTFVCSMNMTILLVEQNVVEALSFADRVYLLRRGSVIHTDRAQNITSSCLRKAFLETSVFPSFGPDRRPPAEPLTGRLQP